MGLVELGSIARGELFGRFLVDVSALPAFRYSRSGRTCAMIEDGQ